MSDVAAGLHLAVRLDDDTVAQVLEEQRLLRLAGPGSPEVPASDPR